MDRFFAEGLKEAISTPIVSVSSETFKLDPAAKASIRRNKELDILIDVISAGHGGAEFSVHPAGTVRNVSESMKLHHLGSWTGVARGVIYRGRHSKPSASGQMETTDSFTAHEIEWDCHRETAPAFVIEWISNLPRDYHWDSNVNIEMVDTLSAAVGDGSDAIQMNASVSSRHWSKAFHLRVGEIDAYVLSPDRIDDKMLPGIIIYKDSPNQSVRDKIRECLSFAFGSHLVYVGHTVYDRTWTPTSLRSVDAFTIDGAVFKMHDLPPYPVNNKGYNNVVDSAHVSAIVAVLFEKFDQLKFNELSWAYWHAMCAPVHSSAVHFGAVIEQLQRNAKSFLSPTRTHLLDDETWRSLDAALTEWLAEAKMDDVLRRVLTGKMKSLNQAPVSIVMKRLVESLGLQLGEVEVAAWRDRNRAAHGGVSDDHIRTILNGKLLRLLFHRLLAGITYCSDRYIDYYNIGFPVRKLSNGIPQRV